MDFKEKKEAMMVKYAKVIEVIAEANGVDLGVAFDMLDANINRGANYPYVDVEAYRADDAELLDLAKETAE